MNRYLLLAAGLLGLAFLVLVGVVIVVGLDLAQPDAISTAAPTATASPETVTALPPTAASSFDPIQLAWFYRPPDDESIASLAQKFDFFILSNNDEAERDELRAHGVDVPILQYLRMDAIHDPGSCSSQPSRNQAANQVGDFCRISTEHPEWFLRDEAGAPIADEDYVYMDPASQGWRDFWLERARVTQEFLGWDGVFLDNAEASLAKRERNDALPAAYPDEASYQAAVKGFLKFIYAGYFEPADRPLYANIISVRDSQVWLDYLDHLDGAMIEAFAVDWEDAYLSPDNWVEHLFMAEEAQRRGKRVVLIAQGAPEDAARQQFALASYLLVTDGRAYFRYADAAAYRQAWLYENYALDLGQPLGPRYQDGNAWVRDFERGSVRVDPVAQVATFASD